MLKFGLRQLSHFAAVADAGSYREAAEKIFIAQPALSISIRKLEESLGVTLFDRGPRGVTMTAAGRAFLIEARRSLAHAEQARKNARLAALGEWGVVRLGFVGSAVYRLLPEILPGFAARHPGVTLELSEGTTVGLIEMIRRGQLDAGVIRTPVEDCTGLHVTDVEEDDFVAVVPANHPLASRKKIHISALAGEPFVMFSKAQVPGLRESIFGVCRDAGFTPRVTQEATQAVTVVGLVGSGLGVALVPSVIARFTYDQVRFLNLSDKGARPRLTLAIAMQHEGVSEAAKRLCDAISHRQRSPKDAS